MAKSRYYFITMLIITLLRNKYKYVIIKCQGKKCRCFYCFGDVDIFRGGDGSEYVDDISVKVYFILSMTLRKV